MHCLVKVHQNRSELVQSSVVKSLIRSSGARNSLPLAVLRRLSFQQLLSSGYFLIPEQGLHRLPLILVRLLIQLLDNLPPDPHLLPLPIFNPLLALVRRLALGCGTHRFIETGSFERVVDDIGISVLEQLRALLFALSRFAELNDKLLQYRLCRRARSTWVEPFLLLLRPVVKPVMDLLFEWAALKLSVSQTRNPDLLHLRLGCTDHGLLLFRELTVLYPISQCR